MSKDNLAPKATFSELIELIRLAHGVMGQQILTTCQNENRIPHNGWHNRDFTTPKQRIQPHHKAMCD